MNESASYSRMRMSIHVAHDPTALAEFCRRWHVREMSLFGSALREDFGPRSDVDLLVEFLPDAPVSLWDWGPMLEELRAIFGRKIDLVEKTSLRNPLRRRYILAHTQVLYAA